MAILVIKANLELSHDKEDYEGVARERWMKELRKYCDSDVGSLDGMVDITSLEDNGLNNTVREIAELLMSMGQSSWGFRVGIELEDGDDLLADQT